MNVYKHNTRRVTLGDPKTLKKPAPKWQEAARELKKIWNREAMAAFGSAFPQTRTAHRAIDVMAGMLFSTASGTIADSIRARGLDQQDGCADMRVLSKRLSDQQHLFHGVFKALVPFFPKEGPITLAIDDTVLPKRGKKTAYTRWCHNALVPPWQHGALMMGHPIFHGAILIPDQKTLKPMAITVAFEPVEALPPELRKKRNPRKRSKKSAASKKKGTAKVGKTASAKPAPKKKRKATGKQGCKKRGRPTKAEAARRAEEMKKLRERFPTAPDVAVAAIRRIRGWMDEAGLKDRLLVVCGDNSYTNATVFMSLGDRCVYVGRTRPDAVLQYPGRKTSKGRTYGPLAPKPSEMATDKKIPSKTGKCMYGGDIREVRYKEVGPLTRRTSTKKLPVRLLLLRPTTYHEGGQPRYSHQAYLLTSDFSVPAITLIDSYLQRWAIEVNHRMAKTDAKIGQAQVRVAKSVCGVHPAMAAAFALLWVCILKLNGGTSRTEVFLPTSHWQEANFKSFAKKRKAEGKGTPVKRASAVDVLALFREAMKGKEERGILRMAA